MIHDRLRHFFLSRLCDRKSEQEGTHASPQQEARQDLAAEECRNGAERNGRHRHLHSEREQRHKSVFQRFQELQGVRARRWH